MAEQTITITIDKNGKINAETLGIKGEMCINELQELLEDEGNLLSVKKSDEYYQEENIKIKNTIKNKRG